MTLNPLPPRNPLTNLLLDALENVSTPLSINDLPAIEAKVIELFNTLPGQGELQRDLSEAIRDLSEVIRDLRMISPESLTNRGNLAQVLPRLQTIAEGILCVDASPSAFYIREKAIPIVERGNQSGIGSPQKTFDLTKELTNPEAQAMAKKFLTKGTLPIDFDPFQSAEAYQNAIELRAFARKFQLSTMQSTIEDQFINHMPYNLPIEELVSLYQHLEFSIEHTSLKTHVETLLAKSISKELASTKPISEELSSIADQITSIDLEKFSGYTENNLELILKSFPNLETLTIPYLSQQGIELISNNCPHLTKLNTRHSTFSALPTALASSLEELRLDYSKNIQTVDCPRATWIKCSGCHDLTSINVPLATTVNCVFCIALTSLECPQATWIKCTHCISLTSINAPLATTVNCMFSDLTSLECPQATWIDCRRCNALTSINAPLATTVNCKSCTVLTLINVAQDAEVIR